RHTSSSIGVTPGMAWANAAFVLSCVCVFDIPIPAIGLHRCLVLGCKSRGYVRRNRYSTITQKLPITSCAAGRAGHGSIWRYQTSFSAALAEKFSANEI